MDKEKVLALAKLARIEISDSEAENLSKEFDAILGYVGEIKKVGGSEVNLNSDLVLKNIMRPDENPHESGIYTEKILNEAPEREGEYIKVKKIL
jgi:aspartyl-tRNA(Asn)/glutamyl-tRNA(Gln) amidotransferase subunit C